MTIEQKMLTVKQVAEYLGVNKDTVYSYIRSGWLKAGRLGKGGKKSHWRISESDLQAFISGNRKEVE